VRNRANRPARVGRSTDNSPNRHMSSNSVRRKYDVGMIHRPCSKPSWESPRKVRQIPCSLAGETRHPIQGAAWIRRTPLLLSGAASAAVRTLAGQGLNE